MWIRFYFYFFLSGRWIRFLVHELIAYVAKECKRQGLIIKAGGPYYNLGTSRIQHGPYRSESTLTAAYVS